MTKVFSNPFPMMSNRFMYDPMHDTCRNQDMPSVNIKDEDEKFVLEMAAPGLSKDDFKMELKEEILSISFKKEEEKKEDVKEKYTRKEFSRCSFRRSFSLPEIADADNISAEYVNGILTVVIPKKEEAKPKEPRMIAIS